MNNGLLDKRQVRCERRPVHMCCSSHGKAPSAPLAPVFECQATCLPWNVWHFAHYQGPWPEHGVHGSGAMSRRKSKPSIRGSGAVTRVGILGVPMRVMLLFF